MGEIENTLDFDEDFPHSHTTVLPKLSGFCIWKWIASDQRWVKIKDYSALGYDSGPGPSEAGRYDGQIVRWASIIRAD